MRITQSAPKLLHRAKDHVRNVVLASVALTAVASAGTNEINGVVYHDVNGDGNFSGDIGAENIVVELYEDTNANGIIDDGAPALMRTLTRADGSYTFTEVPNGTVIIKEIDPPGAISTNDPQGYPTDSIIVITLYGPYEIWGGVSFLDTNIRRSEISGGTWIDTDGTGTLSTADWPQENVTVNLLEDGNGNNIADPDDLLVATSLTNFQGIFRFQDIPAGNYVVTKTNPPGHTGLSDADAPHPNGPDTIALSLDGTASSGNNFLSHTVSISGSAREDLDLDGDLNDAEDPGLMGVLVMLYEDTDGNGRFESWNDTWIDETWTKDDGRFQFTGLGNGNYFVVEQEPIHSGSSNDSDGVAHEPSGTDNWIFVPLTGGTSVSGLKFLDADVHMASTISGSVRHDLDGDGDLGDPDPGLAGIRVSLRTELSDYDDPESGDLLHTVLTDANGNYTFRNVAEGWYAVVETDPIGATSTNDKDDAPLSKWGTDHYVEINPHDSSIVNIDFLDTGVQSSVVRGRVLGDTDGDHVISAPDQPITNVPVSLHADANGNGLIDAEDPLLQQVRSDSSGTFEFTGVTNGRYIILQSDLPGATSLDDTGGDPTDNMIAIEVISDDSNGHIFLDDGSRTYAIGGHIFAGEVPVFGVSVTLRNETGDHLGETLSGSDGSFQFPNLPDGLYTLTETNPPGTTGGSDSDGGDPDVCSVLLAGADSLDHDFINTGITLASISGRVLEETNGNSLIDDDDAPITGAAVQLIMDLNGNGFPDGDDPLLSEQRTGWQGRYTFPNLLEGDYIVLSFNAGGFSVTDADGPVNGPDAIAVTLAGGTSSADNDFLDDGVTLRRIKGTVTDGSNPIPGVVITLETGDGEYIAATSTDGLGEYIFQSLPNGSYLVHETDPVGTTGGSDYDGSVNGDNTIAVTISFTHRNSRNFTDIIDPESFHDIAGHVRDDTNADGNPADPSDRPVDNAELILYRDADEDGRADANEEISRATTDDSGAFLFSNLPDGNYLIAGLAIEGCLSQPTGTSSGEPGLLTVTVAGQHSTENTLTTAIDPAGYFYDSVTGEILTGGSIEVTSAAFGAATIIQSGVTGQYSFVVDSADTYTMVITPPDGYFLDTARPVAAPSYDPTGMPDPDVIGSIEDPANPGHLVDASAGANQYYLTFDLEPGDPLVLSNNIPLRTSAIRSFPQFLADHGVPAGPDTQPVPDQAGQGGNPDRDIHSNLLEYALTEDPTTGASTHQGGVSVDLVDQATGRIDVTFTRIVGTLDLIYTLQAKNALTGTWNDLVIIPAGAEVPTPFVVTPNGDDTETLNFPDVAQSAGISPDLGFVRLLIALDADQDGSPDTLADGTPAVDHTQTFGWQRCNFNASQTASFSHPFSNAPVFSGTVDYVQGFAVNVGTSSNSFDLSDIIGSGGSHYLQVTSGPLEGQRFDIASAGVTALTLVHDPDIFSDTDGISSLNTSSGLPTNDDLAGHRFIVVPHLTVDQLFDKNAAFAGQASSVPSRAGKIFFFNNRSDTPGLESLLLVDLGTEQRWIRSNDFAQLTDQGSMPIDRCSGTYIYPGLGPITNQFAIGMVADHAVAAAFNSGYNLAGSPFPLDQTPTGPNGRAMTVANGFAGGINPTQASELLFWNGDFTVDQGTTYAQGYDSYMQLDGGGMQQWIDVSDQQLNDMGLTLLLESHRAITVKIGSGATVEPHVYPRPGTE